MAQIHQKSNPSGSGRVCSGTFWLHPCLGLGHCWAPPVGCKPLTIALFRVFWFKVPELSRGLCCSCLRSVGREWECGQGACPGAGQGHSRSCQAGGDGHVWPLRWVLAMNFPRGQLQFLLKETLWKWQWILPRMALTCSAPLVWTTPGDPSWGSWLQVTQHQLRANVSYAALPSDLREMLQRRLGDLERQLLSKVAELEDEKSLLHNETSAHRQKTESALNALLERVSELEKGNSAFKSPDEFKVSLPLRTNYLYGKIKKTLPELYAFTVCLWLRSSASPGIGTPFSYAVPGQANEIVLIEWGNNPIELLINDKVAQLPLFISDGKWHHICITWTTRDGMWEAFQDGEKLGTGENLAPWHPIKPGGVLILGQEQDTVGGRFDATQAFVGEMSQFNIWDRVLRAEDIMNIANCSINMPGNIIPWVDNNVDVFGGATKWPVETCEERLLDL
uniref:Neuronal pentraxin 2 n=1 Tax=Junco hyemalis TaxID=40217 RepID=A0A8C5NLG4_JUNHY